MKIYKFTRRLAIAVTKPCPPARKMVRRIVRSRRLRVYNKIKKITPTEPKTIIFESFMGRSYSDSPKAIYLAMLCDETFADYHMIWVFREKKLTEKFIADNPDLSKAELVQYGTPEYYRSYARAGVWITNSRLANYLQPDIDQKYIQTWHGTAMKRLGHDICHDGGNAMYRLNELILKNDLDVSRYTAMVSPSPFMTEVYKTAFALANINPACQIWQTGYPRNDRLTNATDDEIDKLKQYYNIPLDKQVILYTPTWRDNQHSAKHGYTLKNELDFDAIKSKFGSTHIVLFRAHYFIADQFNFTKFDGFVRDVSHVDDINDLYLISDMMITDYSSTCFDYAILKRPMIFYMYDLDDYKNKLHGFYYSLDRLPGPIATTTDEVINVIIDPPDVAEKYQKFTSDFNPLDDGKASKRVIKEISKL